MRYLFEGSTDTSTTLAATSTLSASTTSSAHWGHHTLIVIEVLLIWHVAAKRTIVRLMTLFYSLRLKHILLKTVQVMAKPTWKEHPTLVAFDLAISVEVNARFYDFIDHMLVESLWRWLFLLILDPAFVMLIVQRASLGCSRCCENISSSELRGTRWGVKTAAFFNRCRSCRCLANGVWAPPQKWIATSLNTWRHRNASLGRNRPPGFESRNSWATSTILVCFLWTGWSVQGIWVLYQSQAV